MPNGPEQRSAVNDGNAGYVSAPSVRHTAAQPTTKMNKQAGPMAEATQNLSNSLGNAFSKYVKEDVSNIKEQRKLSGVAKAGMQRSMAEVDVDVKQSKWTDYVFGEDVEYRAAQQQVITNGVEAKYREELANIDKYKGFTEREYGVVMKESLDQLADQYKDDPETKALATNAWITGAGKLVNKHHKEHFAYKQTEMTRIERETTKGRIDQMVIEEGEVTSPEDVKDYNRAWDQILSTGTRPAGMTEIVKRNQLHEVLQEQLISGNVTSYKQALVRDFYADASPDELAKLDRAIGKNDTKFGQSVNVSLEETVAAMTKVDNYEDAHALIADVTGLVDQHETRQTGSPKSQSIIAEARSRIARMLPDFMKKVAKANKHGDDVNGARIADRKSGYDRGVGLYPYKKATKQEAFNLNFAEDMTNIQGGEEMSGQEAAQYLLTDTNAGRIFTDRFAEGKDVIPVVSAGLKSALDGTTAMADPETGEATEQWKSVMTLMDGMDEVNSALLKQHLGGQYKQFKFYQQQTRARVPPNEMRGNYDKLVEGLANKAAYTGTMNLPEGVSKRDYVLENAGLGGMNIQAGSEFVQQFDEGMALFKGDKRLAMDYAKTNYNAESVVVGDGVVIQNTGRLNADLGGYDIQAVFAFADSDKELGTDLIRGLLGDTLVQPPKRGFIADLFGDDREAEAPSQLSQVKGLNIDVAADGDGLILSAANGRIRRLTTDNIKGIVQQMEAQQRQSTLEAERIAAAEARKAAAHLEYNKANPLGWKLPR